MAKVKPFDAAEFLRDDVEMLAYIRAALEDGSPLLVASALGDVARARGMTKLSEETGLSRESLYKSLSGQRAPTTDTLFRVLAALDLKLDVRPVTPHLAAKRKMLPMKPRPQRPIKKSLRSGARSPAKQHEFA